MYVRAATVQVQPEKMQELIDLFKDTMAPVIEAKKGFQGQYLMTDAGSGRALTFSFWETEEDVLATEYLPEQVRAKFGSVFAGHPDYDDYELSYGTSAWRVASRSGWG